MTVEEYINIDVKPFHYADRFCANHNIKAFAYNASEMARKEEREKAIENDSFGEPLTIGYCLLGSEYEVIGNIYDNKELLNK